MSRSKAPLLIFAGIVGITLALGLMLLRSQPTAPRPVAPLAATQAAGADTPAQPAPAVPARAQTLLLYCAAGIKNPVVQAAADYEKEFGTRIDVQFGGSGTLLANMRLSGRGDLFLPADGSYLDLAQKDGLIDEVFPLASMTPVIAVKKGNPAKVAGVTDLLRPGLRVAICNPKAASIGQVTEALFSKAGLWKELEAAARDHGVFKPTVNDIANDVRLGTVDAAVVWDTTVRQPDYAGQLEALPIEGAAAFAVETPVAVLKSTAHAQTAIHFARYLAAADRGLKRFEASGFTPVAGDVWEEHPKLLLFSGAVNRVGIGDAIAAFEAREGATVTTVYNGCGILNGQIQMGERPDAYYTCDSTFMAPVAQHFLPYKLMSQTDIVMLVPRANPKNIRTLNDLTQPGLRIGLANETQSTLGTLTARMLKSRGIYDLVQKNVVANAPTADLLVNQIRTGSLDAVIVYRANTIYSAEQLMAVTIDDPLASASQSLAIGRDSKHRRLAERFAAYMRRPEVLERLQKAGFNVVTTQPPNR